MKSLCFLVALVVVFCMVGCGDTSPDDDVGDGANLAPKLRYPPSGETMVYAMWGSATYHRLACRFIKNSDKPVDARFEMNCERATKMGLMPCCGCWKAPQPEEDK